MGSGNLQHIFRCGWGRLNINGDSGSFRSRRLFNSALHGRQLCNLGHGHLGISYKGCFRSFNRKFSRYQTIRGNTGTMTWTNRWCGKFSKGLGTCLKFTRTQTKLRQWKNYLRPGVFGNRNSRRSLYNNIRPLQNNLFRKSRTNHRRYERNQWNSPRHGWNLAFSNWFRHILFRFSQLTSRQFSTWLWNQHLRHNLLTPNINEKVENLWLANPRRYSRFLEGPCKRCGSRYRNACSRILGDGSRFRNYRKFIRSLQWWGKLSFLSLNRWGRNSQRNGGQQCQNHGWTWTNQHGRNRCSSRKNRRRWKNHLRRSRLNRHRFQTNRLRSQNQRSNWRKNRRSYRNRNNRSRLNRHRFLTNRQRSLKTSSLWKNHSSSCRKTLNHHSQQLNLSSRWKKTRSQCRERQNNRNRSRTNCCQQTRRWKNRHSRTETSRLNCLRSRNRSSRLNQTRRTNRSSWNRPHWQRWRN